MHYTLATTAGCPQRFDGRGPNVGIRHVITAAKYTKPGGEDWSGSIGSVRKLNGKYTFFCYFITIPMGGKNY